MPDPHAPARDLTPKPPDASRCIMNEIVMPNDTNGLGNLMGGRLLHFMDICAAISAQRHSEQICVTASVDNVDFQSPIYMGEVVTLESVVNRAFRTSMEIEIHVWAENPRARTRRRANRALYTFVAVDATGTPQPVPPVAPVTDDEHARYDGAARRRELRLVMAGRLPIADAQHLRALLETVVDGDAPDDVPAAAPAAGVPG